MLSQAKNPTVSKLIKYLWREGAKHGSGSTGAMIRLEKATGISTFASGSHLQKGKEGLTRVRKLLNGNFGELNQSDRKLLFEIVDDLTKGTGLKF